MIISAAYASNDDASYETMQDFMRDIGMEEHISKLREQKMDLTLVRGYYR